MANVVHGKAEQERMRRIQEPKPRGSKVGANADYYALRDESRERNKCRRGVGPVSVVMPPLPVGYRRSDGMVWDGDGWRALIP